MGFPTKDRIRGVVYAYSPLERWDLVKGLGTDWIRLNVPFPWEDDMNGKISPRWEAVKAKIRSAHDTGLKVMPSTPTIFGYPEGICGKIGTPEFFKNVRYATAFMAEDLGDAAPLLWQCMNELDIPTFSGNIPTDICVEACRESARGVMDANPGACCGTNFASWREESRRIGEKLFRGDHPFGYVRDDQYFGSWQGGSVEDWPAVLDGMWDAFGMPILVNEWGYSSGGVTLTPEELVNCPDNPEKLEPVCYHHAWCNEMPGGHNEDVQAAYMARGLEIFAEHPHVMGNFMFCFSDAMTCWHCHHENCPAECYWGLCDVNCVPKKAYYAARDTIRRLYF